MSTIEPSNKNLTANESVISLIRRIQQGQISPRNLRQDDRRRCVEHFSAEGYSVPEMSEILEVHERTIARDRVEIRHANSLERSPSLAGEFAGRAVSHAEWSINQLLRIARDRSTDSRDRIESIRASWFISNQLIERLQSLGYLPNAATEIRGQITHNLGSLPDSSQLQDELTRLDSIVRDESVAIGEDDQRASILAEIATMKQQAGQLVIVDRIDQIKHVVNKELDHEHDKSI